MTSRDFCYWLQGWFEINETIDHRAGATPETLAVIKNHLALVFAHEIDPQHAQTVPAQAAQAIHDHGTADWPPSEHDMLIRC